MVETYSYASSCVTIFSASLAPGYPLGDALTDLIGVTDSETTTYTDETVVNGTTYYYVVTAVTWTVCI